MEAAIHATAVIVTYNVRDFRSPGLAPHDWTVMTPQEFLARYGITLDVGQMLEDLNVSFSEGQGGPSEISPVPYASRSRSPFWARREWRSRRDS